MVVMSGAKALVEALRREKVEVIFGLPGGAIMPVYDVLYDSDIRHVLVRHEQCAAHAAEGYARASGRPGVCMATSGPGATNLVTGITDAYMDSVPVVAFTGQVPTFMVGRDAFQEADIIGITAPITKHNYQVRRPEDIPYVVKEAFYVATTGRPGPVLVDLPRDTQVGEADIEFPEKVSIRGYKPQTTPHPLQVKKAAEMLVRAEKPLILAGGGVIISGASKELVELAEYLLIPVSTTLMGKGCFPENHPLSLGMMGMHGTIASNKAVLEADLILAVGVRFSDRTTGKFDEFAPEAKIIHVDIDPAEIGKNIPVDVPIVGDAKTTLRKILDAVKSLKEDRVKETPWAQRVAELKREFEEYAEKMCQGEGLKPPKLMKLMRELLPPKAIVTTEVGQNQMWAALYFKAYHPRTFISSGGLGTMGFGFPASIGAKAAAPDVPVVDIAGDGSFLMTQQELACSVSENIPVTVVILNNSMLGMVAQWQRLFFDRRYASTNLGEIPNFVQLAKSYGAEGYRVDDYDEFTSAFRDSMKNEVTTVIDVPISPEENVFPMVPAGRSFREMIV